MKNTETSVFDIKISTNKAKLRYLKTQGPGITRQKRGDLFYYYSPDRKRITDIDELNRIKSLVIPPAWRDVWISPFSNTHLQATGIDTRGRKQYRYHTDWNKKRSETKFEKLPAFVKILPRLRTEIEKHLKHPGIGREKVIATVVDLMSKSYLRIGNSNYAKENGSFGLTTLHDRHVNINGNTISFEFRGKKGVMQAVTLKDRRLARIVKSCRDIPGHELFQFYDEAGQRHVIDSGDVNHFMHEVCGDEFSAKDFRTWAGTMHAFRALLQLPAPETETEFKRKTAEVVKQVSQVLGNTPAVCRKYYIHPLIFDTYNNGRLAAFFLDRYQDENAGDVIADEIVLLEFLERQG